MASNIVFFFKKLLIHSVLVSSYKLKINQDISQGNVFFMETLATFYVHSPKLCPYFCSRYSAGQPNMIEISHENRKCTCFEAQADDFKDPRNLEFSMEEQISTFLIDGKTPPI